MQKPNRTLLKKTCLIFKVFWFYLFFKKGKKELFIKSTLNGDIAMLPVISLAPNDKICVLGKTQPYNIWTAHFCMDTKREQNDSVSSRISAFLLLLIRPTTIIFRLLGLNKSIAIFSNSSADIFCNSSSSSS